MPEPDRPTYVTEPSEPTLADYYAAIDAIDLHIQEASSHMRKVSALVKEVREMFSLWQKASDGFVTVVADLPDGWPWTEPELSKEALKEDG